MAYGRLTVPSFPAVFEDGVAGKNRSWGPNLSSPVLYEARRISSDCL